MDLLGFLKALFSAISQALGWAKQEHDTQTGINLQQGRDARDALNATADAIAARDAVVPLRSDGLRVDGTRDPDQRD